jgi:hypothetical protein
MADTMIPTPEPTRLTSEHLSRGLASLREIIETRLAGMDKASELLHEKLTRLPTESDRQVTNLNELFAVKSVQKQFDERDIRGQASEDASKLAVNAALQAQKEAASAQNNSNSAAITKSEGATTKQIDGILALLSSNTTATNDKITAINARLDRGEGINMGGRESRVERRLDTSSMVAIISLGLLMISVAGALLGFALHH